MKYILKSISTSMLYTSTTKTTFIYYPAWPFKLIDKLYIQHIPIRVTIQKKKVTAAPPRKILVLIIHVNVILPWPRSLQILQMNMIHLSTRLMDLTIQKTVRQLVAREVVRKKSTIAVASTQWDSHIQRKKESVDVVLEKLLMLKIFYAVLMVLLGTVYLVVMGTWKYKIQSGRSQGI